MAGLCAVRFLSAVRAVTARCKLPFALHPRLSPEDEMRTKGITKERKTSMKDKGKNKGEAPPSPYTVPPDGLVWLLVLSSDV